MAALRAIEVLGTLLSGLNIDESMMGFVVTHVYIFFNSIWIHYVEINKLKLFYFSDPY